MKNTESNTQISITEAAMCILVCAGILNQKMYELVGFQNNQIDILKRMVDEKRSRLVNSERSLLAQMARKLDRHILEVSNTIVNIDTFHRWYRKLISLKYTAKQKRGRPGLNESKARDTLQMLRENPTWGNQRIADRLEESGITISAETVRALRIKHGFPPANAKHPTNWLDFYREHWNETVALDFATWEVIDQDTKRPTRNHALYAIRVATREVRLLGVRADADSSWVANCCRTLTDPLNDDPFMNGVTTIVMDRDPLFTKQIRRIMQEGGQHGLTIKRTPPKSPWYNCYIERFIGTTRSEVGKNFIPFSTHNLEQRLKKHVEYYNCLRTHQGLTQRKVPNPSHDRFSTTNGPLKRVETGIKDCAFYVRSAA